MKHILITGTDGNIGKEIVLELFKKKYQISILTADVNKSKIQMPLPVRFIGHDLYKFPLETSQLLDIDTVLIIPPETKLATQKDLIIINNLMNSFVDKEVHFVYLNSYKIYKHSNTHITENSPVANSKRFEYELKIEKSLSRETSTIIRSGFILHSENITLNRMIAKYRFYLGSRIKNDNYLSWIHFDDLITNIEVLINTSNVRRVVNLASGSCKFSEIHGYANKAMDRTNFLRIPTFIAEMLKMKCKLLRDKSLEIKSIHTDILKYKFTDFGVALKDICNNIKTPTIAKPMFHYKYTKFQFIKKDIHEVFDFFKDAKNLESITPRKLEFKITSQSTPQINEGTKFTYTLKLNKVPFEWTTIIENWNPPHRFTDYQKKGPYQVWYHTHSFYECAEGTLMIDEVKYRLPLGFLGDLFGLWFVKKNVSDIFQYRFNVIRDLL